MDFLGNFPKWPNPPSPFDFFLCLEKNPKESCVFGGGLSNYIDHDDQAEQKADPLSECEKTEETLMTSWYPAVTAVFNDKTITKVLPKHHHHNYHNYQHLDKTEGTEGRAPPKLLQLRLCFAFHSGFKHNPIIILSLYFSFFVPALLSIQLSIPKISSCSQ